MALLSHGFGGVGSVRGVPYGDGGQGGDDDDQHGGEHRAEDGEDELSALFLAFLELGELALIDDLLGLEGAALLGVVPILGSEVADGLLEIGNRLVEKDDLGPKAVDLLLPLLVALESFRG